MDSNEREYPGVQIDPPAAPLHQSTAARSLPGAWLRAAFLPGRTTFATLASAVHRRWVAASLLISLVLVYLARTAYWLMEHAGPPAPSSPTSRPVQSLGEEAIYQFLLTPADFVLGVLAAAYLVARFAPAARGPIGVRFRRVLRPYVLALVPNQLAWLIFVFIPISNGSLTDPGQVALAFFNGVSSLALGAYTIALAVNSLSAGSGRSRWGVFMLWLLAGLLALLLTELAPALIARPFGVHLLPFPWLYPR